MFSQPLEVRRATVDDVPVVADLARRLLGELGGFQTGEATEQEAFCARLLTSDHYTAFLASDAQGVPVGLLTLNEVEALYVAGCLGWIQELYVTPQAACPSRKNGICIFRSHYSGGRPGATPPGGLLNSDN